MLWSWPGPIGGVDYPNSWAEYVAWFPDDAACVAYPRQLHGRTASCARVRFDGRGRRAEASHREPAHSVRSASVPPGPCSPVPPLRDSVVRSRLARVLDEERRLGARAADAARAGQLRDRGRGCTVARRAMVIPGRDLPGDVEVDETFVGGDEPGLIGGRAREKKALVAIAVECRGNGSGRTRQRASPTPAAARCTSSSPPTRTWSMLLTDGWHPYKTIDRLGYGLKQSVDPGFHRTCRRVAAPRPPRRRAAQTLARQHPPRRSNPNSSTTTSTSSRSRFNRRDHTPQAAVLPPPPPGRPRRTPLRRPRRRQADPSCNGDHHPHTPTQDVRPL